VADLTRATPTFVLPKEDVEVKVAQVFKRLSGPVLADPVLKVTDKDGGAVADAAGRAHDLLPARLPDLFEGDQVVLLGRYVGEQPLRFRLEGNYLGKPRTFSFEFGLEQATTRNAFVPRLWASRKIGTLVQAIRDLGAAGPTGGPTSSHAALAPDDPRLKELVDEIVRLSTEFGVLTEYTAFLAREGTDLTKRDEVLSQAGANFRERAMASRSGLGSVNQDSNGVYMKGQSVSNMTNAYLDPQMRRVAVTEVQQVNDRAYYKRGNRWIDSRLVNQPGSAQPARVIEPGSREYDALVDRMVAENRNGSLALPGEKVMEVDGQTVLVKE
jgi:Ca-activated chloride channel family protein